MLLKFAARIRTILGFPVLADLAMLFHARIIVSDLVVSHSLEMLHDEIIQSGLHVFGLEFFTELEALVDVCSIGCMALS